MQSLKLFLLSLLLVLLTMSLSGCEEDNDDAEATNDEGDATNATTVEDEGNATSTTTEEVTTTTTTGAEVTTTTATTEDPRRMSAQDSSETKQACEVEVQALSSWESCNDRCKSWTAWCYHDDICYCSSSDCLRPAVGGGLFINGGLCDATTFQAVPESSETEQACELDVHALSSWESCNDRCKSWTLWCYHDDICYCGSSECAVGDGAVGGGLAINGGHCDATTFRPM